MDLDKAKEIRAIVEPHHNCAQSVIMSFNRDTDISDEVAIQRLVYFGKKLGIDCLGEGNCKKVWDRYKENSSKR